MIEALTYRFRGHSMADPVYYRTRTEEQEWHPHDPIAALRARLLDDGTTTDADLTSIDQAVIAVVDDAVQYALNSAEPAVAAMYDVLYAGGR
jgi:pyruvate dehydrogenase E1 component alpha subunit